MRTRTGILTILAVICVAWLRPTTSQAYDSLDYVSIFGGWDWLDDYSGAVLPPPRSGNFDPGLGIGVAVGNQLYERLRGEFEFVYRNNDGDQWTVGGITGPFSGSISSYSNMLNLATDCEGYGRFKPYLGVGVGVAVLDGVFTTGPFQHLVQDTVFAYQGFVGLSYQVNRTCQFFVEYRYFATEGTGLVRVTPPALDEEEEGNFDYVTQNVFFGLRHSF
jgi:opacity protein-like surface antigen